MPAMTAPWKSLNLSKLNPDHHQNTRVVPISGSSKPTNLGLGQGGKTIAGNRRQKGYNNDGEPDDDLEEASRILTLDDFDPNFTSQKPFSPPEATAVAEQNNQLTSAFNFNSNEAYQGAFGSRQQQDGEASVGGYNMMNNMVIP